ncbi:MAG TPA: hypothetical protein VF970_03780 [Gemmatimonadales bacterium]
MLLTIGLLALLAGMVWLLAKPRRAAQDADRDEEVLREAEEEVRGLDATTTPDEADDHLTDWGPGVPR